jgi:uncharacterized membrane protein YfcA
VDFAVLFIIGLGMGLFGGMLGIGGSIIMIPAMTLLYGENQHLYQASAMICNFFVSASALFAHRKAEALVGKVLIWLVPAAMLGILGGVMLSNTRFFSGGNSYLLARIFGAFLVYVVILNSWRLLQILHPKIRVINKPMPKNPLAAIFSALCGAVTGLGAGLLGIGAGTVSTPLQQVTLKLPIRNAMSNSAFTIICIAWLGAIVKNWTLPQHGIAVSESLKMAAMIIPGAIIGGFVGGHLMHALPKNLVRAVFILVCIAAAIKLLTVQPG